MYPLYFSLSKDFYFVVDKPRGWLSDLFLLTVFQPVIHEPLSRPDLSSSSCETRQTNGSVVHRENSETKLNDGSLDRDSIELPSGPGEKKKGLCWKECYIDNASYRLRKRCLAGGVVKVLEG